MVINEFLVRAKVNTYAAPGERTEKVLADGGKSFSFRVRNWKYQDKYYGFNPFIGQEIVWKDGRAVWTMNYSGKVVSKKVVDKDVYSFLRQALKLVKKFNPFRGPAEFSEGEWKYISESIGAVKSFAGLEEIFFKNTKVYELYFNGGLVKR